MVDYDLTVRDSDSSIIQVPIRNCTIPNSYFIKSFIRNLILVLKKEENLNKFSYKHFVKDNFLNEILLYLINCNNFRLQFYTMCNFNIHLH